MNKNLKSNPDYVIGNEIRCWAPYVPSNAINYVSEVLTSKWLNTGSREKIFREKLCEKFKFQNCIAVNSGTSALKLGLSALGVTHGDEVISTPFTFMATNTAILEVGAKPIFVDINYNDCNIDVSQIEKEITSKTKAIMIVHYAGNPVDLDELRSIAKKHGLPIIEDSAHALGATYKNKFIGETGECVCFSTQVIKIINTGDGGFVASDNQSFYEKAKKISWYGIDRDFKKTSLDPLPDNFDGGTLGYKMNMNDIIASLGIASIEEWQIPFKHRQTIGKRYREELSRLSKIKLLEYKEDRTPNYQIFPVHVKNREEFATFMKNKNIFLNINNRRNDIYPMFGSKKDFYNLKRVDEDLILLPIHTDLTDSNVDYIIQSIKEFDQL